MADSKITDYAETSVPEFEDLLEMVEDPSGTPTSRKVTLARLLGTLFASTCEGRLTTESGVPVSTSDRTAQSTLYFTPYIGNRVALYDGTRWKMYVFAERSLALSGLTSGKPYDVFLYDNSGTLTIELLVWTNDTTRATALALQDGVYVKTGATTRRYLGTIYTTGTTTTEDSAAKRFVWSADHRVARWLSVTEGTTSWTASSTTYLQARGQAANQVEIVVGLAAGYLEIGVYGTASNSGNTEVVGIGIDSTTVSSAQVHNGTNGSVTPCSSHYRGCPGVGRHYIAWLEKQSGGTTTWFGNPSGMSNGLIGAVWG